MRLYKNILIPISTLLFLMLLSTVVLLAGGGAEETETLGKISTEGLGGANLWFVNLYNNQRLLFAIVTLVSMGIIGIIIAYVAEFFLRLFGLETTKMEHKE